MIDPLTGVPNRRGFDQQIEAMLERARETWSATERRDVRYRSIQSSQ